MIVFGGLAKISGHFFWCNDILQGMNDTKALTHVMKKKGMRIKSCYSAIGRYTLTRYQEIKYYKAARKCFIQDYSENIKSSISRLQNKSSANINTTIHHSYKGITSPN